MKRISSVYVAVSLDGYIARKNGAIDWLNEASTVVPEGEDCGFLSFMNSVDLLVMGRRTFETVLSFDGEWPYGDTPVLVLSRSEVYIPRHVSQTVAWSNESPAELASRMEKEGARRLYIDGGATIHRFLREGLIKDIIITVIPVAIGGGIPLFGELEKDIQFRHIETEVFDFGFVQSTYEVNL
jgi:dihydrofolate reductase